MEYKKILLGLDVGSNSVGWCLTDEHNNIIKKSGKSLWGVRLFDSPDGDQKSPAATRRGYRNNRRRLKRRRQRIELLQELFAKPMHEVDSTFFMRLDESFYHKDDRSIKFDHTLFNDINYKDSDYYREYPTIYHLRKHLLESDKKEDLRFIYLALHHMIKYRGNFLFEGNNFKPMDDEEAINLFLELNTYLELLEVEVVTANSDVIKKLKQINSKSHVTITDLKENFNNVLNPNNNKELKTFFIPFMAGGKIDLSKLSCDVGDSGVEVKITADTEDIENKLTTLISLNPDKEDLLNALIVCVKIYQFFLLGRLLGQYKYISDAMVARYNEHHEDLLALKKYIKANMPKKYYEVFRDVNIKDENNYPYYIGSNNSNGVIKRFKHQKQQEFIKYIEKILDLKDRQKVESNPFLKEVRDKIDSNSYLNKQNSPANGIFPYQLNLMEMEVILEKQSKYYPFLLEKDNDGLSIKEKIISLLKFHIPYYVGPLVSPKEDDEQTQYAWVKRTSDKIYPWNFDKIVDKDTSAENFIRRMLNRCTYLPSCYCLPINSIIFSYYNVLATINKIAINGALLNFEEKEALIRDLFAKNRKITKKKIVNYYETKYQTKVIITSSNDKEIDEITCSLASYYDFVSIFGKEYVKENIDTIEKIIQDIVIFEDKSILEKRLKDNYNIKDKEIIKKIKGLTYQKFSRLSKELLMDIYPNDDDETGECVLSIMQKTNQNLQEIISNDQFDEAIKKYNAEHSNNEKMDTIEEYVDTLYVSPGMKRPLIQAYRIIDELEKIMGRPIDEYYVECTRTNRAQKKKTTSRYEKVKALYDEAIKFAKEDTQLKRMRNELSAMDQNRLQSDKYYLYFTQLGKDMYTGKSIDLDDLSTKYDIDHIVPQSLVKDDSLENRVLVLKSINNTKSDAFPIPRELLFEGASSFYEMLYKNHFIGEKKYHNLIRRDPLTPEELEGFVNRQLVYTSQSVKGLVKAIKYFKEMEDFKPKIIYSKGENVSDFRKTFDIIKSRTANNFHHAHDAYLNIVVGRALNCYFKPWGETARTIEWMHDNGLSTNPLNAFFNNKNRTKEPIMDGDIVVWNYENSINKVKNTIFNRFDIMVTTRAYVGTNLLNKVSVLPKGEGNIPVKTKNTPLTDTSKYGGFTGYAFGFYCLIKNNYKVIMEPIPTMFKDNIDAYLSDKYGKNAYQILLPQLKINSVVRVGKKKFCITGKTNESFLIKNLNERIFNQKQLSIIRRLDKLMDKIKNSKIKISGSETDEEISKYFVYSNGNLTISPAANDKTRAIVLSKEELGMLYDELVLMFSKEIYSYSNILKLAETLKMKKGMFLKLSILGQCQILSQVLLLLKCNERKSCDLSLIGLSKNCGILTTSTTLSNCTLIAESITGFYTKELYRVD